MTFDGERPPFARWLGPFSPARGRTTGFRFHSQRLGTWVEDHRGREFWPVVSCLATAEIAGIVLQHWGGGRVLMLPNGLVIKPLPGEEEVGRRVVIGRFRGAIVLEPRSGGRFDLSSPATIRPGDAWPGPKTTGIECVLKQDGSLECHWYHPTRWGRDEIREVLRGPDRRLADGFRQARLATPTGRVRVTENGLVITSRSEWDGTWAPRYVGRIEPESWPHRNEWLEGGH